MKTPEFLQTLVSDAASMENVAVATPIRGEELTELLGGIVDMPEGAPRILSIPA